MTGPDRTTPNRAARNWTRREPAGRLPWSLAAPLFRFSPRPFWGLRRTMLRAIRSVAGPGGLVPIRIRSLFRQGKGRCDDRRKDEHVMVTNKIIDLPGELLDDRLNPLAWWAGKHNSYPSRAVIVILNLAHGLMVQDSLAALGQGQLGTKRWSKEKVHMQRPGGLRALRGNQIGGIGALAWKNLSNQPQFISKRQA